MLVAMEVTMIGVSVPPRSIAELCMNPALKPRRFGVDSASTQDWAIGSTGPSARPITPRTINMLTKFLAIPERKEQMEKIRVAGSNTLRFEPMKSDIELNTQPEMAQQTASPEAISPICVLFSPRSGAMNGN